MEEIVVKFVGKVGDGSGKASVGLHLMPKDLCFY